MKYPVAERFVSPQGEGVYSGQQMAFIRLVGCSVGQRVCTACDTNFDRTYPELGGGLYTAEELAQWALPHRHTCLTGGEPLDRDVRDLITACTFPDNMVHIETSGTVHPDWLDPTATSGSGLYHSQERHAVARSLSDGRYSWQWLRLWLTVSPKPGYRPSMIKAADEIKVILGGLGDGLGWPTVDDALRWADEGKTVFIQPRNHVLTVDRDALAEAMAVVAAHPSLRLSVQLHKFLQVR